MDIQPSAKIYSYAELSEVIRDNLGSFFGMVKYPYQQNTFEYQNRDAALASIHPRYVYQICVSLLQKGYSKQISKETLVRIQELLLYQFNDPNLVTMDNRGGINFIVSQLLRAEDKFLVLIFIKKIYFQQLQAPYF